jgi:dihydrofolate reductase
MPGPSRIEGYAIVSSDGMITDASGVQPPVLKIKADQEFFLAGLARADALAHGRNSFEGLSPQAYRHRLLLTRKIADLVPNPQDTRVLQWNPRHSSLDEAWRKLGLSGGTLAVIGGTDVFGHFLELGYDAFYLTHVAKARLPGGRPLFPGVPIRTPEDLLASQGLKGSLPRALDGASGAALITWRH